MGSLIFVILLLLSFYLIRKAKVFSGISVRHLFLGWGVKIFFSLSFILIFTFYYGSGVIYGDAYNFVNDGHILYEYSKIDFLGYLKLLFGFADDPLLEQTILSETQIWSYGENGDLMNDNRLIIRINSLIHFISLGNIYVHGLIFSFLSYFGILFIYRSFSSFVQNKLFFFVSLVLFPSFAFWGSGISKEAVLILALGLFFYGLLTLLKQFKISAIIYLLTGIGMLLMNKPYVGLVVLSLSIFLVIGTLTNWSKKIRLLFPILLIIGTIVLTYTPSSINLLEKISYKQRDLMNLGKGGVFFITDTSFCAFDYSYLKHFEFPSEGKISVKTPTEGEYKLFGEQHFSPFTIPSSSKAYDLYLVQIPSNSYITATPINYERSKMITTLPEVIINTLIRPFPWDGGSNLKYISFISNLLFLAFLIFSSFKSRPLDDQSRFIRLFLILSAVAILLLIGWTTPILGALVRYKTAAELLLIISFSINLKPLK